MYQNIHIIREKDGQVVHLWDDTLGYQTFKYKPYCYVKDPNGDHMSMFGDRCRKIYRWKDEDPEMLLESDVKETTRTLVDLYTDDDTPSIGHTIMTFDIECEMISGLPDPLEALNEITSIAAHDSVSEKYIVFILDKKNKITDSIDGNTEIRSFDNELNLLLAFVDYWEEVSPTIVTGWNIDYFDIPMLHNRIKRLLGETHSNRLSPIRDIFYSPYRQRFFIGGVSCLDYLQLYKIYTYNQESSYSLNHIANKELKRGKIEYSGNLDDLFEKDIHKFVEYNIVDVELVVEMERKLKYIDLARGICHAGRVPYEDFVFSSKYLEGAILSYLKRRNLVACNKPADREKRMAALKESGTDKFIGAYVKDPIVGKYDWVYDLDLTSLYPSIIMSLNISPETKIGKVSNWDVEKYIKKTEKTWVIDGSMVDDAKFRSFLKENDFSISSNGVLYRQDTAGCIADILRTWFDKRLEYVALTEKYGKEHEKTGDKDAAAKYAFYDKRQLVQKILLNSMYGVLGLPAFRFYDVDNAEAVTTTGQTVIKNTAKMANIKYNEELNTPGADSNIYIDTDSVFFSAVPILEHRYPNYTEWDDKTIASKVDGLAGEMQDYINAFYDVMAKDFFNITNHRFEIKKELISRSGIWIAKKRYAQWVIVKKGVPTDKLDVKGLDVVRSSFPKAFRKLMSDVLVDILKGTNKKEIDETILQFKRNIRNLATVEIAKSSTVKNLSKYLITKKDRFIGEFLGGTPAHVKAAICYNDLLEYYDCPYKYPPFKNGDKMKWVYLRPNPLNIDGLGFRGEGDPPEILEYIDTYVDTDRIFSSELESKLNDFYHALNWVPPTENAAMAGKFFDF